VGSIENPFDIRVYDRDRQFQGFVTDPTYVNMVPSFADQGYGSFMVTAANPHMDALIDAGARVTVDFKGENILSGPIRSRQGDVKGRGGVTFQVLDDSRFFLTQIRGWVMPSQALGAHDLSDPAQAFVATEDLGKLEAGTTHGHYAYVQFPDGTAAFDGYRVDSCEAAIKWICKRNMVDRLGLPMDFEADKGRGGSPWDVMPKLRWSELYEYLTPFQDKSGLGIRIYQPTMTDRWRFEILEPQQYPQVLTPESGIITEGTYTVTAPTVTRAIAGGPSETAAGRVYWGDEGKFPLNDTEAKYGTVLETFLDATSDELNWPDGTDDEHKVAKYYKFLAAKKDVDDLYDSLQKAVHNAKQGGRSSTGLSLKLAETDDFTFGGKDGIHLGDTLTVRLAGGVEVTDQVTSAQLVFSRDAGVSSVPIVGEITDDPNRTHYKAIRNLARALARQANLR
jgi:hypothetical protein